MTTPGKDLPGSEGGAIHESIGDVLGDLLRLTLVRNAGAAFSTATGYTVVLSLVALFTGAFLVYSVLALSVARRSQQLALLGVLAGASSGLIGWRIARAPELRQPGESPAA